MKTRNTRKTWHNGLGLGQIMATLLVVLPTIAFSVTFLLSYWNVMQVDYKLKLIANLAADYANAIEDKSSLNATEKSSFQTQASKLCPKGTSLNFPNSPPDANGTGEVEITVQYTTPATDTYLANKTISTTIQTYSYHDQNMSVTLICQ